MPSSSQQLQGERPSSWLPVSRWLYLLYLALFSLTCSPEPASAANSDANRLYEDLMMSYNRFVRPVQNDSDTLMVKLGLKLSQLIDVVSAR